MWYAKRILLLVCALFSFTGPARAELWAHGSETGDPMLHEGIYFTSDYGLIGGGRYYSYNAPIQDEVIGRIFDERHDRFVGFGPGGNQTLMVDESLYGDVTATLGKTTRLNLGGYEERVLCYASSRPGDDTVALFTLSKCPENCSRVSEIQVRARKREVRVLDKCAAVPGVHVGIATESGLKLGMTATEAEAVLGPPQHIQKGLQGTMWFYGARVSVQFSDEEAGRRGYPQLSYSRQKYPMPAGFDKFIVLWLREDRVSAWRVWLDWGL